MSNNNNSPIFIHDHYGLHPQFHYFQLLEEARQQKKPSIRTRKRWWRNPLLFFSWPSSHKTNTRPPNSPPLYNTDSRSDRTTCRPMKMDIIPYISLGDHHHRISPVPMPIYLVT